MTSLRTYFNQGNLLFRIVEFLYMIAFVESERIDIGENIFSDQVPLRIASIQYSEKDHTATITFKNANAAETAAMVSHVCSLIW